MNKFYFLSLLGLFTIIVFSSCSSVQIEEGSYEGRAQLVVRTSKATYWYDRAGGGLSRLIDSRGNDWIGFKKDPLSEYPASAAAGFRGMPNFVFQSDDGGAGHPGFDQCISEILDGNKIRTTSISGKWQWTWTFYDTYASVTMEKVDTNHAYWFLYEGTPGGKYAPDTHYWGTDTEGYQTNIPDYYAGERVIGNWRWAYFGDQSTDQLLFIGMSEQDEHNDLLGFLGNTENGLSSPDGMVVFGLGRQKGAIPLMTAVNNTFYLGLLDQSVSSSDEHESVATAIQTLLSGK
ncbi:MAG: hypothetical protein AAF992_12780 [Bacteroidota bacterium]